MIDPILQPIVDALPLYDAKIMEVADSIKALANNSRYPDIRTKAQRIGSLCFTREMLQEELDQLKKHNFQLPRIGEYLCYLDNYSRSKAFLMVVTEITTPQLPMRDVDVIGGLQVRSWRAGSVHCAPLTMYGKKAATGRIQTQRYSFTNYAAKVAGKEIRPAPYILLREKGYTEQDVENILPMLPFYPIPEGGHLSVVLLRQLAREARKTLARRVDKVS